MNGRTISLTPSNPFRAKAFLLIIFLLCLSTLKGQGRSKAFVGGRVTTSVSEVSGNDTVFSIGWSLILKRRAAIDSVVLLAIDTGSGAEVFRERVALSAFKKLGSGPGPQRNLGLEKGGVRSGSEYLFKARAIKGNASRPFFRLDSDRFHDGKAIPPGIIDGRVKMVPSESSEGDSIFTVKWRLNLSHTSNIRKVVLRISERPSGVLVYSDTVQLSELNDKRERRSLFKGKKLHLQRGRVPGGGHYRFEADIIGRNGNSSPKPFHSKR